MNGIRIIIALGAALSFSSTAFGEAQKPQTRQRPGSFRSKETFRAKTRTASRQPASYDIRADQTVPTERDREWTLQLALLGGYAYTNSNNASAQAQRSAANFDRNVYLGGVADLRFKKYAGAEVEGFYNVAPSQTTTALDRVTGTSNTSDKSLQQYGGMATLKGQYPIFVKSVRIQPMLGAGFGTLGLRSASTDQATQTETDQNLQMWGFVGVAGVEVEPFRNIVLMGDYARSFGASGSTVATSSASLSSTRVELDSARFERLRVGGYYRFTGSFMAGGQYVARRLSYVAAGNTAASEETLNQFLGMVMVGF